MVDKAPTGDYAEEALLKPSLHLSHQHRTARTAGRNPKPLPLPNCTESQLDIIRQQLPAEQCDANSTFCSFYMATKCPDPTWLQDYYFPSESSLLNSSHRVEDHPAIAIYLGCNKGMDAINTLRMLSYNQQFDRERWRATLDPRQRMGGGACRQASSSALLSLMMANSTVSRMQHLEKRQKAVLSSSQPRHAKVYCVEAMPGMARLLAATARNLSWDESLLVTNAAMSDSDGETHFPDVKDESLGVEFMGLSNCQENPSDWQCRKVVQRTLDTFGDSNLDADAIIDILSIDVEGYDFEVLMGARRTLKRVRYLEFEINAVGRWPEHSLRVAIKMLSESDFACYWAGTGGHLWRITGCFLDHYEKKYWANVACVNRGLLDRRDVSTSLATRMESSFLETLAAGAMIQYRNKWMDGTDGITQCTRGCRQEYRRRKNEVQ